MTQPHFHSTRKIGRIITIHFISVGFHWREGIRGCTIQPPPQQQLNHLLCKVSDVVRQLNTHQLVSHFQMNIHICLHIIYQKDHYHCLWFIVCKFRGTSTLVSTKPLSADPLPLSLCILITYFRSFWMYNCKLALLHCTIIFKCVCVLM